MDEEGRDTDWTEPGTLHSRCAGEGVYGKSACMMVNDQILMYYIPYPLDIPAQGSATMTSACAGATVPKGASTLPRGHRPAPRQ